MEGAAKIAKRAVLTKEVRSLDFAPGVNQVSVSDESEQLLG